MLPVNWPSASIFCDCASCSCARSSDAYDSRRSVMSRVILTNPTRVPASSRTASMTALAQNGLLSRPTRQPPAPHLPSHPAPWRARAGSRRRGLAAVLLLLGVEPAEMLTDDFRRGVLVNTLRPHVPVGDGTAAVEHENRVIGDALDDRAKAPFALHQRFLRLSGLGDVVLERRFDALALLDLAMKDLGLLLEGRRAFLDRFLQLVMRALQILFGAATVGYVLRDHHEVTHGAAAIRDSRHAVADPQARTVGQHISRLDDKSLSGVGCLPDEAAQVGQVVGLGQIFDSHLQ